ncbi:DMT family transporter [Paraburkholderia sp. Tr-20389]|uniref:DMT family transporter n=1 Tax=Paraburkholderia sp. Tr-20389 TaxID=2703903 RepID=UPI00197F6147|nr:DMT family transporter [Paraburkholderia sp. Tr-20389]MBN3755288.1 DMT family transporter [Paraburkholderia sp. Tr-20389]
MIGATGLWAISLIAPLILAAFSPTEITAARYLWYGIVSAAILLVRYRHRRLGVRRWIRAAFYGLSGNVAVSILVSFAVQNTGAEVVIPIIGLLPISISVAGSRHLPVATWRRLLIPFALVTVGLIVVLTVQSGALGGNAKLTWAGTAAALLTVALWTWYALSNARFLQNNPSITSTHWSCAVGVATLLFCLVMAAVQLYGDNGVVLVKNIRQEWPIFALVTISLGAGTSWLATALFNRASHELPMGLVGQLVVLETLFGILYICLYKHTIPPLTQTVGMLLAIAGIWLSARVLLRDVEQANCH